MDIEQIYNCFKRCSGVTTDSRKITKNSLFISLRGETFNGNKFALHAIESGCLFALVDDSNFYDANNPQLILVEDCLLTLQQLATFHREKLATPILAITGTNGKTTTKELITAVLKQKFKTHATQGNFNNHIGVPLTLLQLKEEHEIAIVEIGASHPGEIEFLTQLIRPNFGLVTNVGKGHLEGFGSFQGVIQTKTELYTYLRKSKGKLFIQADNPYLMPLSDGIDKYTYGEGKGDIKGHVLIGDSPFLTFEWSLNNQQRVVQTNLVGSYNLDNCLAAVAVGSYFGVSPHLIDSAISNYKPTNNRSQLSVTDRNKLIIDAYNANPTSMQAALINFKQLGDKNKVVILGDMKELGKDSIEEHKKILTHLKRCSFSKVYLIGAEFGKANQGVYPHYDSIEQLIKELAEQPISGYTILIKGSNSLHLTKVVSSL